MVGQFIDTFWRKSFIGDLRRARKVSEDDTEWTITYNGKVHQFQFVWLQGICVKILTCDGYKIYFLGDYTIIAGKLLNTTSSDHIIVSAYKIQWFKTSSKHELIWPFEVVDISQRVYH
ncbi:unnamed protein product [Rotaria sp. Silwood2]|nr:unnamed protein product [Rotaria sp. Silwood2]CAF3997219.1 unnamed protein product [Rotaria sp. Silwood2]CAF4057886.1 unnamed protein product [Rotaria sp. Silwood2]